MARTSSLAREAVRRCTRCGSERIVKNGKNACGRQLFRCRACGACPVPHPKNRQTAPVRQAEVLRAVATERLSLRAARVFGVGRNTLTGWLKKKAEALPPLSETLLPVEPGETC